MENIENSLTNSFLYSIINKSVWNTHFLRINSESFKLFWVDIQMPRFFVETTDIAVHSDGTVITIRGSDALHISKVLRMRPGEHLTVCDSEGREYDTVVNTIGENVLLDVLSDKISENEPPYKAFVYQALVRGDRFDTVLQKSTELGAAGIIPVITSRCTVRIEKSEFSKKVERWQRIVVEAAKQCGRASIPQVSAPMHFSEALKEASNFDIPLFCYEGSGTDSLPSIIGSFPEAKTMAVIVGPEGGYSFEEAELAFKFGLKMTGLGRRILRTETAAPFVLSCLSYKYEL